MKLLVEITSTDVFDGENTNTRTGESSAFKYQKVWLHIPGEPHPSKNKRVITKEAPVLPAGWYEFDLTKVYSDWSWSRVTISTRHLKPVDAAAAAALSKTRGAPAAAAA